MLSLPTGAFKVDSDPEPLPRLPGVTLLAFTGPDAQAFLQAQTMNDVVGLGVGRWHWNGWLNPKGRVIALWALLHLDEQTFLAVLPDFPASELRPMLQRFVFRARLVIAEMTGLQAFADRGNRWPADTPADAFIGGLDSGIALNFDGDGSHRRLVLLPRPLSGNQAIDGTDAPMTEDSDAWLADDIAHGLPRLGPDQREAWTPQMLSLERLAAFSLRKGCYPGQEIVARTHYLGQAKRGLRRLVGDGLAAGAPVHDADGSALGTVVAASRDGSQALAVVALEKNLDGANCQDRAVAPAPLLNGLQRPV